MNVIILSNASLATSFTRSDAMKAVVILHNACIENGISFNYHQTGAKLIKNGKLYDIPRKLQHTQAHKAGLNT